MAKKLILKPVRNYSGISSLVLIKSKTQYNQIILIYAYLLIMYILIYAVICLLLIYAVISYDFNVLQ